jgi:hypothetical protein
MRPFGEEDDVRIELTERRRPGNEQIDEFAADVEATRQVLRQTAAEEEAHYRANDQWDDKKDKPKTVEATYSFWKGSDWTHEEKQSLRLAQAAISLGSIYGAGVVLSGVFRILGAQEGLRAAEARSDTEQAVTGNVTTVNQALEASALENYRGQVTEVTNAGIAAFGAVVVGCYQYWTVCANHKENVEKLNRPEITKKREGLEARLQRLQDQMNAELLRLREAMAAHRLEEAHSTSDFSTETL